MKNLATSQTVWPVVQHSHLRLIAPEVYSIAALVVAEYGSAATPLAKRLAVAAFEQGQLHGFAGCCLVTIALHKLNFGEQFVWKSKHADAPDRLRHVFDRADATRTVAPKPPTGA